MGLDDSIQVPDDWPIETARPGDLQNALAGAEPGSEVWAIGGKHDPRSETTVPEGVTLRWFNAWFEPSSDYPGFFVAHGAELHDLFADVSNAGGYTSTVVALDSGRAGGAYSPRTDDDAAVTMAAYNPGVAGTALQLYADGSSISIGNTFEVQAYQFGTALDLVVDGGSFLNSAGVTQFGAFNCGTGIDHRNTDGNPGPADLTVEGWIQPDQDNSDYGIRNRTGEVSVAFQGRIWDQGRFNNYSLAGQNIHVYDHINADGYQGNTDGSFGQTVTALTSNGRQLYGGQGDTVWEFDPRSNGLRLSVDGTRVWNFGSDGHFQPHQGNPSNGALGLPQFDDPTNAPNNCLFWDASAGDVQYKDPNGTVLAGGFA